MIICMLNTLCAKKRLEYSHSVSVLSSSCYPEGQQGHRIMFSGFKPVSPHSPAFLTPLEGKLGLASAGLGNVLLHSERPQSRLSHTIGESCVIICSAEELVHSEPPQSRLPHAIGLLWILFFCEIISNLPLFLCSNASVPILLPALYRRITWPPGCPILIPTFTRHLFKSQLCTERFSRWEQQSLWDNRRMKKAIQFVRTVRGSHLQGSLVGQTRKRSDAAPGVGNRTMGMDLDPEQLGLQFHSCLLGALGPQHACFPYWCLCSSTPILQAQNI